jgi:hypothetical protein
MQVASSAKHMAVIVAAALQDSTSGRARTTQQAVSHTPRNKFSEALQGPY